MKKKQIKKQKLVKVKIDDYYNNGLFELVRYGKFVSIRNLCTPEQQEQIQAFYRDEYPKAKERINEKVKKIKEKISACDPLMLLKFARDMAMLSHLNKFSEIDYTSKENIIIRAQEYIQSILVSTENHFNGTETIEDQEKRWYLVLTDIEDLYKEFEFFYHYWAAYKKDTGDIPDELMDYIVESQMLYIVRGNRYQIFQLEPLKKLLPPHNDILIELFGVTAEQIIEGLEKLEYSMSQGLADALMEMKRSYDEVIKVVDHGEAPEIVINDKQGVVSSILEKVFGVALNDIFNVTGWDVKFIDALSLGIGEYTSFFDGSEFSGWPIVELPTKKKPFIKIGGISYGFDYYSLFDNIYRAIQKEIFRLRPEYVDTWNKRQNLASENMVKTLFMKLLPGAKAFTGNYYPVNNSLKQMNENDLLIIYENYLFIIEIKAGSFPQTPPIKDFDAHVRAFRKLVQEADSQCSRTLRYLNEHQPALFYDFNKQKKFEIDNISKFTEVFLLSVTVDNFNAFAAKAEKLNFITLSSETIVISYDDLLVYEKYFESPIYFLHFLRQRKSAIKISQITMNDELDHLGMYIYYNNYSIACSEFPEEDKLIWYGFRQDLDDYFCKLYLPNINITKPQQDIPLEIKEIVQLLEQGTDENRIEVAHFFLDMSPEAKKRFCETIQNVQKREKEIGRMIVINSFDESKYCVFVTVPGIKVMSRSERQDYVFSAILRDVSKSIMWIDLDYDNDGKLFGIKGKNCSFSDISIKEIDRLKEISDRNAKRMIENYRQQNHKKIGRNELCPCGSGKKFKKCCIHLYQ
ncbi:MAG TPA: SEC-C domain-containing protein [Bacillota bacterium]|nr:SEC-C domain-containing protein [Bacillota bacterium]